MATKYILTRQKQQGNIHVKGSMPTERLTWTNIKKHCCLAVKKYQPCIRIYKL